MTGGDCGATVESGDALGDLRGERRACFAGMVSCGGMIELSGSNCCCVDGSMLCNGFVVTESCDGLDSFGISDGCAGSRFEVNDALAQALSVTERLASLAVTASSTATCSN